MKFVHDHAENYLKEKDNNMIEEKDNNMIEEEDNMFKVSGYLEFASIVGDSQLAAAYWDEWFEGGEEEEKEYFAFNDYLRIRREDNGEYIPEF